ncbi:hypothetical protein, partial [Ensifer sp. 4252]|uniref:hypothetical protein n=1 Tax=Ensifer sp. 4252 TaxID=3373915 RepID=UPI003D2411BC
IHTVAHRFLRMIHAENERSFETALRGMAYPLTVLLNHGAIYPITVTALSVHAAIYSFSASTGAGLRVALLASILALAAHRLTRQSGANKVTRFDGPNNG